MKKIEVAVLLFLLILQSFCNAKQNKHGSYFTTNGGHVIYIDSLESISNDTVFYFSDKGGLEFILIDSIAIYHRIKKNHAKTGFIVGVLTGAIAAPVLIIANITHGFTKQPATLEAALAPYEVVIPGAIIGGIIGGIACSGTSESIFLMDYNKDRKREILVRLIISQRSETHR